MGSSAAITETLCFNNPTPGTHRDTPCTLGPGAPAALGRRLCAAGAECCGSWKISNTDRTPVLYGTEQQTLHTWAWTGFYRKASRWYKGDWTNVLQIVSDIQKQPCDEGFQWSVLPNTKIVLGNKTPCSTDQRKRPNNIPHGMSAE